MVVYSFHYLISLLTKFFTFYTVFLSYELSLLNTAQKLLESNFSFLYLHAYGIVCSILVKTCFFKPILKKIFMFKFQVAEDQA